MNHRTTEAATAPVGHPAARGVVALAKVPTLADILFLTEVAALGDHAFSENLPQRNYASVKARQHCRYLGFVAYEARSARRGFWEVTKEGHAVLAAHAAHAPLPAHG